jgi:hypothetical protein
MTLRPAGLCGSRLRHPGRARIAVLTAFAGTRPAPPAPAAK